MFKEKVDLQKNYTDVGVERTAVDDGLRAYLVSVYNHMAGALAVTAAVAFLVANTSLITMMFNPQTGGMSVLGWLFLLSPLIVIFGFNWVLTSGTLAQVRGVFWLYSALMGASLAPILSGLYQRQHGSRLSDYGGDVRRHEHLRHGDQTRPDLNGRLSQNGSVGHYHCRGG